MCAGSKKHIVSYLKVLLVLYFSIQLAGCQLQAVPAASPIQTQPGFSQPVPTFTALVPLEEQALASPGSAQEPQSSLAPPPEEASTQPSPLPESPPLPTPEVPLPSPDPWDGDRRVNILILGLDYADWESTDRIGPARSDTMILLTVDPVTKTAGVLSIPRDLWVDIPGMIRPNKINAAHRFGELYKLPGGGPALAARTVEQLLGVKIDYYARIDFSAFENFIDEIGGITIDVPEAIRVDPIGPGNTVTLEAGRQKLDGPTALAYARNRSTAGGDFTRARRQQQVMLAIRSQILKLNNLPRLVLKAPTLYRTLEDGIVTNLELDEAIRLAWLAQYISLQDIKTAAIGPNETVQEINEDGQYVLLPRYDRIRWLLDDVFSSSKQSSGSH